MPKMISDDLYASLQEWWRERTYAPLISNAEKLNATGSNLFWSAAAFFQSNLQPPHVCTPACLPDTGHQQLPPCPQYLTADAAEKSDFYDRY